MKQIEQLIPLVNALVYYSQIHTVTGVRAANMVDHETAWRKAQKWLWDNCNIVNGEYVLNKVQNDAVSDTTESAGDKKEKQKISDGDIWFKNTFQSLLGAEVYMVALGIKKEIDRKMLADWILEHYPDNPIKIKPEGNTQANPSIQCSVCGQWKRLHGKGVQRFYSCCGPNGEYGHLKPVCDECCKNSCPYRIASPESSKKTIQLDVCIVTSHLTEEQAILKIMGEEIVITPLPNTAQKDWLIEVLSMPCILSKDNRRKEEMRSQLEATHPDKDNGKAVDIVCDATVYKSPYPSVVTYRSDKNFVVRLKAFVDKSLSKFGFSLPDEFYQLFNNSEDYFFESKTNENAVAPNQAVDIDSLAEE